MARGVTAAVLSWRSPRTLERSLSSYHRLGLESLVTQRLVFVQEAGDDEIRVARSFGWDVIVDETNIGIGPAYARLVEASTAPFFLFLECDWQLTTPPATQLAASSLLIERGSADIVRLRSTRRPGFPLGVLRVQNRETLHPDWLIESVFYEPEPWATFPGRIARWDEEGVVFAIARPIHAGWTNNPHLARRDLLVDVVHDSAGSDNLETSLAERWSALDIRVAHAPGLFTHNRADGPAINRRPLSYRVDQQWRWRTRRIRRRFRRSAYRT